MSCGHLFIRVNVHIVKFYSHQPICSAYCITLLPLRYILCISVARLTGNVDELNCDQSVQELQILIKALDNIPCLFLIFHVSASLMVFIYTIKILDSEFWSNFLFSLCTFHSPHKKLFRGILVFKTQRFGHFISKLHSVLPFIVLHKVYPRSLRLSCGLELSRQGIKLSLDCTAAVNRSRCHRLPCYRVTNFLDLPVLDRCQPP